MRAHIGCKLTSAARLHGPPADRSLHGRAAHASHEMVHLREPHHTPEVWRRVEGAMPNFERRKVWLAEKGVEVGRVMELRPGAGR